MTRRGLAQHRLLPSLEEGLNPDEYDRLMRIDSVDPTSEEDRYGDEELTATENPISTVADDSGDPVDSHSGIGSCLGVADSSTGFGSASLAEVLNRMPRFDALAACASQVAPEFLGVQTNPRHAPFIDSALPPHPSPASFDSFGASHSSWFCSPFPPFLSPLDSFRVFHLLWFCSPFQPPAILSPFD